MILQVFYAFSNNFLREIYAIMASMDSKTSFYLLAVYKSLNLLSCMHTNTSLSVCGETCNMWHNVERKLCLPPLVRNCAFIQQPIYVFRFCKFNQNAFLLIKLHVRVFEKTIQRLYGDDFNLLLNRLKTRPKGHSTRCDNSDNQYSGGCYHKPSFESSMHRPHLLIMNCAQSRPFDTPLVSCPYTF